MHGSVPVGAVEKMDQGTAEPLRLPKPEQAAGMKEHSVLSVQPTADSLWLLVEEGFNRAREHETGSLFAVANGYLGTRGSISEGSAEHGPTTLVAGVFGIGAQPGAIPELVKTPDWTDLSVSVNGHRITMDDDGTLEHRRVLDMRQGILWREWRYRDPSGRITCLRFMRLASLADRHILVRSAALTAENYSGSVRLESRFPEARDKASRGDSVTCFAAPSRGTIVALAAASRWQSDVESAEDTAEGGWESARVSWSSDVELMQSARLDRVVCVYTSREASNPAEAAGAHLGRVLGKGGMPAIVKAHQDAWSERWSTADVQVDGDEEAQRALRFSIYHLISAANPEDERVSIGARALTGESYKGHVFWDTEIYMLPFYIFTHPPSARALLMYRYHTLPAAREKARAAGYRGALYAWESADDGSETTPATVFMPDGRLIRVLCGEQEQHISADVAYGVWQYWNATGDDAFFLDAGAEILMETARFWAARVTRGDDGQYHIRHVIGPDEYHEGIDDDAYTNVMAQWNLERGAQSVEMLRQNWPDRASELLDRLKVSADEPDEWRRLAERIYTGLDAKTGLFEQFQGYFGLEDIDLADFEPRSAPMDVLLGRERTQQSQVVKQADVVMLLALLWDRFSPEVREANFRYYEPRTGHGSSLSPGAHALVAARLGDVAMAYRYFLQAARIDLADNMGNASGGVHAAALGGLWQAAVMGFGGLSLEGEGLRLDPCLPQPWRRLQFTVCWRGRELSVGIGREPGSLEVALVRGEEMKVSVAYGPQVRVLPGRRYTTSCQEGCGWRPWQKIGSG